MANPIKQKFIEHMELYRLSCLRTLIDSTKAFAQKLVESVQEMMLRLTGMDIGCCPKCGRGTMVVGEPLARVAFGIS